MIFKNLQIFILCSLFLNSVSGQAQEIETEDVSGVVRIVRSSPETEIFFVDRKESVIVPAFNPEHNKVLKMSLDSIKNKKAMSIRIDPVSRRFISTAGSKASAPVTPEPIETSSDSGAAKAKAKTSGFKDIPTDSSQ